VLSNGIRGVGRDSNNLQAELLGSGEVHIVETGTSEGNKLNTVVVEDLKAFTIKFIVNKGTDGTGMEHGASREGVELFRTVGEVEFLGGFGLVVETVKEVAVVLLGREEGNVFKGLKGLSSGGEGTNEGSEHGWVFEGIN